MLTAWVLRYATSLLTLGSALLMGLAFVHPFWWWGGVVGLGLFFIALSRLDSLKSVWWWGLLVGTIKTMCVMVWFWSIYPVEWIAPPSIYQLLTIGIIWITVSVSIALGFALFAVVGKQMLAHPKARWLLVPLLPLSEFLGAVFFSLYSVGPMSTINASYSYGHLGYTLALHPWLGMSAVLGSAYSASMALATLALAGYVVYQTIQKTKTFLTPVVYRVGIICVVLFILYFIPFPVLQSSSSLVVSAIATNMPNGVAPNPTEERARMQSIQGAFQAALTQESDVIVFPEAMHAFKETTDEAVFATVNAYVKKSVVIVDSEQYVDSDGYTTIRANIFDSNTQSVWYTHKDYLVPVGEYVPYSVQAVLRLSGADEVADTLSKQINFKTNQTKKLPLVNTLPGVLFCSESFSPLGVFQASQARTLPLVVHPVSHAWFNAPHALWYQLDLMLRTQVRFARTPLVQASNMSLPRAYDRHGTPVQPTLVYSSQFAQTLRYEW